MACFCSYHLMLKLKLAPHHGYLHTTGSTYHFFPFFNIHYSLLIITSAVSDFYIEEYLQFDWSTIAIGIDRALVFSEILGTAFRCQHNTIALNLGNFDLWRGKTIP